MTNSKNAQANNPAQNQSVLSTVLKASRVWMVAVALVTFALSLSSFTSEDVKKDAFTRVCYRYVGPANFVASNITNASNWTPSIVNNEVCPSVDYICGICFDDDEYETLQDALNALSAAGLTTRTGGVVGEPDGQDYRGTNIDLFQRSQP